MAKKIKVIDGMEVEILLEKESDYVARPTEGNEGERHFSDIHKTQEKPEKNQGKTREKPEKNQRKTKRKPLTGEALKKARASIQVAREYLPEQKPLLVELQEKWFLIELLQTSYPVSYIADFSDLVGQIKVGKFTACPRPIVEMVNGCLPKTNAVSRDMLTRTVNLYIEYTNTYSENKYWNKVFSCLNNIDNLLNRALNF